MKKIVFNDQNYVSQFIINNTYNFICICRKNAFLLVKKILIIARNMQFKELFYINLDNEWDKYFLLTSVEISIQNYILI